MYFIFYVTFLGVLSLFILLISPYPTDPKETVFMTVVFISETKQIQIQSIINLYLIYIFNSF